MTDPQMTPDAEALERENKALRLAICPDGSLTDLDDLIDHAAELNLAESNMGKLLNPEQRMLEENKALRGLLREARHRIYDNAAKYGGGGGEPTIVSNETRAFLAIIDAAMGDA